jgi:hypothetical protein
MYRIRQNFLSRDTPQVILGLMTPVSRLHDVGGPRKREVSQTHTHTDFEYYIYKCDKTFLQSFHLKDHIKIHLGIKKYKFNYNECNKCLLTHKLNSKISHIYNKTSDFQ